MLIAVSSFGKGLRWDFLTEPAEAIFYPQKYPKKREMRCLSTASLSFLVKPPSQREGGRENHSPSCSVTGRTTVKVDPCPTAESTQMRP